MTQGNITTINNGQIVTCEAQAYSPAEVDLDDAIRQERAALGRLPRERHPVSAFFGRIGQAIRRYFTYNPAGKRPRAWELDVLRGFILLFVTLDHCLYYGSMDDLLPAYTVVGFWFKWLAEAYCDSAVRHAMQPFGLWLLAFMSGLNGAFTRSKFHRVAKFWVFCAVFMGGYALLHVLWPELVTGTFIFNIIAVLTICFTVWWLLDVTHCSNWLRGYLGAFLAVVGLTYYFMWVSGNTAYINNPVLSLLVYNDHGRALSHQNFEPLLPHLGFFLLGGVVGRYLYADKKTKCRTVYPPKALAPVLLIGKHSLAAYLVLPFLLLGILRGIAAIVGLFY